jgi:hypothetical protein
MDFKDSFFASDAIAKAQGLEDWERNALMFSMMDSENEENQCDLPEQKKEELTEAEEQRRKTVNGFGCALD